MSNPFFSVIIPTYNRDSFLKIAVESVLCQSYRNFELIIIDDGSDDQTPASMKRIKDRRLRYIKQPHKGVSGARNKGISHALGKYICFLDSDDRFRMTKLEVTRNYIEKLPRVRIFHTDEIWYNKGGLLAQKKYHTKPDGSVFNQALELCCISISTACIKKDIFKEIGLFDEKLPACEDYDFWLRVTSKFRIKLIPETLTIKEGGHCDQQSKKFPAMDRFRIYAIKKILECNHLTPSQRKQAVSALRRKCAVYLKGALKRNKKEEVNYYKNILNSYKQKTAAT